MSKLKLATIFLAVILVIIGVYFLLLPEKTLSPEKEETKIYRVGILSGLEFFANTADGFKDKMAELGYIEDENIVYDLQKTDFEPEKERQILEGFVADKVDLIFVFPTEVSLTAKEVIQGTNIPVVFANASIEGVNLVESVSQPGGNITGVRLPGTEEALRRLEVMHELIPEAKRIWIPYPDYPTVPTQLELLRSEASSLGVTLVEARINSAEDMQAALETASGNIDAIVTISEPLTGRADVGPIMANFAAENRLPIGGNAQPPGFLFSVIIDNVDAGEHAAFLADKVLKGIPAGTIPVISPDLYLIINYTIAQEMGIATPEGLLESADEIIR